MDKKWSFQHPQKTPWYILDKGMGGSPWCIWKRQRTDKLTHLKNWIMIIWAFLRTVVLRLCAFTNSVTIIQFSKNHSTDSGTISQNASPYIGKYYVSQLQRTEQSKYHSFCILCYYSSIVSFWNTVFFKWNNIA
jgi:hypothetical protein